MAFDCMSDSIVLNIRIPSQVRYEYNVRMGMLCAYVYLYVFCPAVREWKQNAEIVQFVCSVEAMELPSMSILCTVV